MKITRAYRTELDPNRPQLAKLCQHAAVARWSYNWGLAKKKTALDEGLSPPSSYSLQLELNRLKRSSHAWLYESSKSVPQTSLDDLDVAFKNFLRGRRGGQRVGFPQFKSRKRTPARFRLTGSSECSIATYSYRG